ncbi:DNA-nicking Smr family endonuclease [Novosphingobium sp. PhB55]|nr:DNA-nicking Smr family endonuclease [Novosphingobium sp. PhB55]
MAAPARTVVLPPASPPKKVKGRIPAPLPPKPVATKPKADAPLHLDGSWEKRISKGTLVPDFSLDLHGSNLDQAYVRLMHGLTQAKAMGARVVLIVTGKPRPVDAMDRGTARGAIRAKITDWLAASDHALDIVAIRGAHRRHGGQGAIYVVLKKRK